MRRIIGFALSALLLGGCAVYAEPVPPPVGGYIAPPPVVVAPLLTGGGDGTVVAGGDGAVGGMRAGADPEGKVQQALSRRCNKKAAPGPSDRRTSCSL